jgi:hypothetical protein
MSRQCPVHRAAGTNCRRFSHGAHPVRIVGAGPRLSHRADISLSDATLRIQVFNADAAFHRISLAHRQVGIPDESGSIRRRRQHVRLVRARSAPPSDSCQRPFHRRHCGVLFGPSCVSSGSTAGTPGFDRLARDLPFAVARGSTDGRVHPDPATNSRPLPAANWRFSEPASISSARLLKRVFGSRPSPDCERIPRYQESDSRDWHIRPPRGRGHWGSGARGGTAMYPWPAVRSA